MFTNIKTLLPRRVEALGVREKLNEKNIEEAATSILKKEFSENKKIKYSVTIKHFRNHKLIISAPNAQWAAQVYLLSDKIKKALEVRFPKTPVKEIIITIADKQKSLSRPHSRRDQKP